MNIFIVDSDPTKAAKSLCNKHVVKQVLESAQLLCGVHHIVGTINLPVKFYRLTHKNNPIAVWCRANVNNYIWTAEHALALCEEYTYRYNKIHASQQIIEWCCENVPNLRSFYYNRQEVYEADCCLLGRMYVSCPVQAMPDEYKMDNTVEAYRRYYNECKRNTIQMKWTRREPPVWWTKT